MLDLEDIESVWAQYSEKLVLILRSYGGPIDDAVQEAFIALSGLDELPECPLLGWLR
ncbi:hypothetical protein [Aureliella helgolandensis]|uniref:RNA polymerase sigma-70 region 2 domain-containing protein n=1 Tax=Aureliella helgolandensis TaxID=2527968 RepID=A0A518G5B6_9BACT|nr:hypothetical protein [Aureliella helgolandensis]QDV23783.1 hypothetical protein Q31a_20880 [Aureliella helgolandensis]